MAVPSYAELLTRHHVESSRMKRTLQKRHLVEFCMNLDKWELLANSFEMESSDIESFRIHRSMEEQKLSMLVCWKQRLGSCATFEVLAKALLRIKRTDLAEYVLKLNKSEIVNVAEHKPTESSSSSPVSTLSGEEDSNMSNMHSTSVPTAIDLGIEPKLKKFKEEFIDLLKYIEVTLEERNVELSTLTKRFKMLPESAERVHQTDERYEQTKQRILDSTTIKGLFDNLSELKHWNYMMTDTLTHILKDVEIEDIHRKVDDYNHRLSTFKRNTKMGCLIDQLLFPVLYYVQLIPEVEGWKDKTIQEVENAPLRSNSPKEVKHLDGKVLYRPEEHENKSAARDSTAGDTVATPHQCSTAFTPNLQSAGYGTCSLAGCTSPNYDPANGRIRCRTDATLARGQGVQPATIRLANFEELMQVIQKFSDSWSKLKGTCPIVDYAFVITSTTLESRWTAYRQQLQDQTIEEHYHGTKLTCNLSCDFCTDQECGICGISNTGLDRRCIRKNIAQRFGHGFYLAPHSSKCHDYTQGAHGYRAMLLCDVCPGRKYFLQTDNVQLQGPPPGYDSVYGQVGGSLNYPEIVVYNPDAIVPRYIIVYQKDGVEKRAK